MVEVNSPKVSYVIFRALADDASACADISQKDNDDRIEEALSMDDPEILFDLRKLSGRVKSKKYT